MVATDRAFRALARAEPEVVLALLRLALPGFLGDARVDAESVEDPKLDLPPPIEADLVARAESEHVFHVEGQGYSELGFEQRVFSYHLALVLRHPRRDVKTVALWLTRPPRGQRLDRIERSGVAIEVSTIVLSEVPASRLLAEPQTLCFAPGADAEHLSAEELCRSVARELRNQNASWQKLLMSVTVAAAVGRYDTMMQAMQEEGLEPPIIEDLVRYGHERGVERGRVQMAREDLLELLSARELPLTAEQRAGIDAESDLARLRGWLRRAAVAGSAGDVFDS
jgi:hypothetical protein